MELANLRLLQETKKLSSGKISAPYVLMQVRYSRLQLLFVAQGPYTVQIKTSQLLVYCICSSVDPLKLQFYTLKLPFVCCMYMYNDLYWSLTQSGNPFLTP